MSSVKLHAITKEASRWKGLNPQDRNKELRFKIGVVVGAILLLIISILGFYFGVHLKEGVLFGMGTLCLIGSSPLITWACLIDYEYEQNGAEPDLSRPAAQGEASLALSGNLKRVYDIYYRRNGGLGPLVRQGLMLPEQGDRLLQLLEMYHTQVTTIAEFHKQPLCSSALQRGEKPPGYTAAEGALAQTEKEWDSLQQEWTRSSRP